MNRKRGAQRNNEICTLRGGFGSLQNEWIEALPKTNGRRFQVTPTRTKRRTAVHSKRFEEGLWIASPKTSLTFHQQVGAVQLDQMLAIRAGQGVQSVDVLGEYGDNFIRLLPFYDCVVHRIRSGCAKRRPSLQFVIPMFDTSCF